MSPLTLQTSTGGPPALVALVLVGLLATALLSLVVAYLVIRGYRRNRNRARLYLATGLVFLTTGPILLQFVLTNFTDLSPGIRSAAANTSKLVGLAAMLYAIYGATSTSRRRRPARSRDSEQGSTRADEVES